MFISPPNCQKITLYVGVITSDICNLTRFLASFKSHKIERLDCIKCLKFLVYINEENIQKYQKLQANFKITFSSHKDFSQKPFKKLTIAESRQLIHGQLFKYMHDTLNTYSWVADDDLEIDNRFQTYIKWLPKFKEAGVDVVISPCEGEPANCFYSGLRGQLFDFLKNYKWLMQLQPQSTLPNRKSENSLLRKKFPEYYYDLTSIHAGYLRTPYWIEPLTKTETVAEALIRLKQDGLKLLDGRSVFRQVKIDLFENPLASARPAINRGGNAFILTSKTLLTPNITLKLNGRDARRSDMVWSLINTTYYNYRIVSSHFPVIHHGSNEGQIQASKMVDEITSTCLVHTLREHLRSKNDWEKALKNQTQIQENYLDNLRNRLVFFLRGVKYVHHILSEMSRIKDLQPFTSQFAERFSQPLVQIEEDTKSTIRNIDLSVFFEHVEKEIIHVTK